MRNEVGSSTFIRPNKKQAKVRLTNWHNIAFIIIFNICASFNSIANGEHLRFCVDPSWMPFEGLIDEEHSGIASDYLTIFKALTPHTYSLLPTNSWEETTQRLATGECDLTLLLNSSVEREEYLRFTTPYFFGPNVLVSRANIPFMQDIYSIGDLTLGIVSGYRLVEEIPAYYPQANIVELPSEVEGLKAVESGDIDVYVGSLYSINTILKEHKLTTLKINGWISIQDKLRIGVSKDKSYLVDSFNNAINNITTQQHNEILNKWSTVHYVKETDYTLIYYFLAIVSGFTVWFLWRYTLSQKVLAALSNKNQELEAIRHELQQSNKELEYLSYHDSLTKIYNRHYFTVTLNDHASQLKRRKISSSILMIDLDFFKKINDKYGHNAGDKVLQQFSVILSSVLRKGDVACRWGGEEFMVLLPNTIQAQAEAFADRLFKEVVKSTFELNIKLTLSIGISVHRHNETCEKWIERADKALYEAKSAGRNCLKCAS